MELSKSQLFLKQFEIFFEDLQEEIEEIKEKLRIIDNRRS